MGKESHYSSKKDRVFVRGIQGGYSLKDELQRLRSLPRVIKGKDILFNDGPQSFSKHFIEPVDGAAVAAAWSQSVKLIASPKDEICVLLLGSSVAPPRELADAMGVSLSMRATCAAAL